MTQLGDSMGSAKAGAATRVVALVGLVIILLLPGGVGSFGPHVAELPSTRQAAQASLPRDPGVPGGAAPGESTRVLPIHPTTPTRSTGEPSAGVTAPSRTTGRNSTSSAVGGVPVAAGRPGSFSNCSAMTPEGLLPVLHPGGSAPASCAQLYPDAALAGGSTTGWRQAGPNPPAFVLYDSAMTYDAHDHYMLLFGGALGSSAGTNGLTETWIYAAGNWSRLYPAHSPVSCPGSAMAYDDADGYVVYLAGASSQYGPICPSAGQTWKFTGGDWTQLAPVRSPSPRQEASLANDSADGDLLLFGGYNSSCDIGGGPCGDTWSFRAGNWTELNESTRPSNRSFAGMTYDVADGYVVAFGGVGPISYSYLVLNDTWKFQSGNWTLLHPTKSPPVPYTDGLAYDGAAKDVVYTTAASVNDGGRGSEIVWTFSAGNWTPVSSSGASGPPPPQRLEELTAFDWQTGYFLFFGGGEYYSSRWVDDTWSFLAGNWTNRTAPQPSARTGAATVFDVADGYTLLFGGVAPDGTLLGDTWRLCGGQWSQLNESAAPSPRQGSGLVYDASDGYVLLFGGGGREGDTWTFSAGVWKPLYPNPSPDGRSGLGLVYDAADLYVLLFGGSGKQDTWSFHAGAWTNRTSSAGTPPPGDPANPLAYDALDGYVLLFGTVMPSGPSTATSYVFEFHAGGWTNGTGTGATPTARTDAALAFAPAGGEVLLFGGTNMSASGSTRLGDTWSFRSGTWTQVAGVPAPSNRSEASLVFDPPSQGGLLLLGGGTVWDPWTWGPGRLFNVTFTERGLPTGTPWSVDLNGEQNLSTGPSVGFLEPNGSYTYAVAQVAGYRTAGGGGFTVVGADRAVEVGFERAYAVTFTESGLPNRTNWTVNLSQDRRSTNSTTVAFSEPNGTYAYEVAPVPGWSLPRFRGSVTVNGAPSEAVLNWSRVTYEALFAESGLPSGTGWSIAVDGVQRTSLGSFLRFEVPNGTHEYVTGPLAGWTPPVPRGAFAVLGAPVVTTVAWARVTYAVEFVESGLPTGTNWSVVLNGVSENSTLAALEFQEPNGTYVFAVGPESGLTPPSWTGTVRIAGTPVVTEVPWEAVTFRVTFVESGLPSGTGWAVTLNGFTQSANQPTIEFNESNGTYSFAAASGGGFAPTSAAGTVRVLGADLTVGICFRPVAAGSGTGSSGLFGLPPAEAAAVIGAGLAGAVALFVLGVVFGRRSRRGGPTSARGRTLGRPPTVPPRR